ncbi:MAG: hypothetical protein QGG63_00650 [Candidatus Pacebacteria bacterium]|nr:hypothetical protein [Candidatus Paceibacterota bacterium]|tara:strand:+ start:32238 stop:33317 length:1080 start_codon:yes stop_codon:yes gene_type:complete
MKTIYFIYGDLMTARELLYVARVLEKREFLIRHIVDQSETERAAAVLNKNNIKYTKSIPMSKDMPDVILSGTSATAISAQTEWTKFGKNKGIPTIWFEDTYGTNIRVLDVSPDILCVIDSIASDMIYKTKRDVRIEVVGKPSFESFIKYINKTLEIRENVCKKLRIKECAFIITLWSGGICTNRIEAHIKALYNLNKLTDRDIVYLPRMHPKFPDKSMINLSFRNNPGVNIIDTANFKNPDNLIATSNVNISEWSSNVGYASAVFGIPSVMCLFPIYGPDGKKDRLSRGLKDGIPPLISENAGWGANSPKHLKKILSKLMNNETEMKKQVHNNSLIFRNLLENIGAAERIADVVENCVK